MNATPSDPNSMALIFSVAAAILSIMGPVVFGLLKALDNQREKEKERRLAELEKERDNLKAEQKAEREKREAAEKVFAERLRVDELETVKLMGDLQLAKARLEQLARDQEEMRRQGITRPEWERAMKEVDRRLEEIIERLDNRFSGVHTKTKEG